MLGFPSAGDVNIHEVLSLAHEAVTQPPPHSVGKGYSEEIGLRTRCSAKLGNITGQARNFVQRMTLEDDNNKTQQTEHKMDIGRALRNALLVAKEQGRLTCGVYESGKKLELNTEGVMLCVLPINVAEDVTLQIHFTLIQAFCWENDIQLLKVDSCEKLSKLLLGIRQPTTNDNMTKTRAVRTEDFNCVLVEYPTEECSEEEEDVLEYCKATSQLAELPVVELAV